MYFDGERLFVLSWPCARCRPHIQIGTMLDVLGIEHALVSSVSFLTCERTLVLESECVIRKTLQ